MGEHSPSALPDQADLDSVFNALDHDKAGYITVKQFLEALHAFLPNDDTQEQKIKSIIGHLDPQSDGKIYLDDFKLGIKKVQSLNESMQGNATNEDAQVELATPTAEDVLDELSSANFAEDSGVHSGADDTVQLQAVRQLESALSQHDTDAGDSSSSWDEEADARLQAKLGAPSAGYYKLAAPLTNRGSMQLLLLDHGSRRVRPSVWSLLERWRRGGEESYEDWGEGDPSCQAEGSTPPSERNFDSKPPAHPDSANQQLQRGSDVRGTWPRHRPSLHRPPSANQLAQQLYNSSSGRSSPRTSGDGMFYDDPELVDTELAEIEMSQYRDHMTDQLKMLTDQVERLTSSQSAADSRHHKLAEENQMLRERNARLEDDYRDAEAKFRSTREEEKMRAREKLQRVTREKDAEIERLIDRLREAESSLHKLRQSELSLGEHRIEASRQKSEAERLRLENARLEEKLEAMDGRLSAAKEDADRYREVTKRELESIKRERDHAQSLLEELNSQLESRRAGDLDTGAGGRDRTASAAELLGRYREVELLAKRLTQENKSLREQLEEAQAELLTRGLEEGQALLNKHGCNEGASLAAELETMTKDEADDSQLLSDRFDASWLSMSQTELMDLLVREKDANEKLRKYIDRILLRILEKQPELLEVGMLS